MRERTGREDVGDMYVSLTRLVVSCTHYFQAPARLTLWDRNVTCKVGWCMSYPGKIGASEAFLNSETEVFVDYYILIPIIKYHCLLQKKINNSLINWIIWNIMKRSNVGFDVQKINHIMQILLKRQKARNYNMLCNRWTMLSSSVLVFWCSLLWRIRLVA